MVHARRVIAGSIVVAGLMAAAPASAQEKTFYLDRIQISGAPDDGFTVWRPYMHDKTRLYGSLTLGYSQNPLRDETVTDNDEILRATGNPVANQLISYLMIGSEVAGRVGVNLALPIGLYMHGKDPAEVTERPDAPNAAVETVALHDMRLDVRLPLLHRDALRWGFGGSLWLPTGNEDSFAGDDQVTGMLFTNFEYGFDKWFLSGMIGPHFRPERSITNTSPLLAIASDLRWAFGGYMPFRDDTLRLGLELWGTTGIQNSNGQDAVFEGRNTDLEWLAQGRLALDERRRAWLNVGAGTRLATGYGAPDLRILAQIGYWFPIEDRQPPSPARRWRAAPDVEDAESDRDGDGYPDHIDKCPDHPEDGKEPDPTDGCPVGSDRDGDGIPDFEDACPDVPGIASPVAEKHGCPEDPDRDGDGIPNAEDACPDEPGPASDIAEKHGCPGLARIDDASGEIAILEPIQFEYNSAAIKPVSFPILDEVVGLLKARNNLRIGVYGHTDSRGNDNYNLNLSKRRAASVMKYLADKGIAQSRLESEGYGESKPICNEETEGCWAVNRRVEFKMLN